MWRCKNCENEVEQRETVTYNEYSFLDKNKKIKGSTQSHQVSVPKSKVRYICTGCEMMHDKLEAIAKWRIK